MTRWLLLAVLAGPLLLAPAAPAQIPGDSEADDPFGRALDAGVVNVMYALPTGRMSADFDLLLTQGAAFPDGTATDAADDPGVYLVRLATETTVQTQRLTVTR